MALKPKLTAPPIIREIFVVEAADDCYAITEDGILLVLLIYPSSIETARNYAAVLTGRLVLNNDVLKPALGDFIGYKMDPEMTVIPMPPRIYEASFNSMIDALP